MKSSQKSWRRWLILLIVVSTFMCCYAYAIAIVQPSVPIFMEVFNIDMPTALLLASFFCITSTAMSLPAGLLTDRWGVLRVDIAALGMVLLGWIMSCIASDFWTILVGRSFIGLGTTMLGVVSPLIIISWFPPRELGLAMGLGFIGTPLGIAWGTPLASWLIERQGWRAAYIVGLVLTLLLLLVHIALVRLGPYVPRGDPIAKDMYAARAIFKNKEVWKFAIAVFLVMTVFQVVMSSYQTWLMEVKGLEMERGGLIAGLVGLVGVPTVVLSGWLSGKLRNGAKTVFTLGAYLLMIPLVLFLYAQGLLLAIIAILLGFAFYMVIPQALAIIPPRLVEPVYGGTSLGIALLSFNLAGVIGPPSMGVVYTSWGVAWVCILMTMFAFCAGTLGLTVKLK